MSKGVLYVVATPMGNLDDVTYRAIRVLQDVDLIAAEDTRHTRLLLGHYGIQTPLLAMHEHNEQKRVDQLLVKLHSGVSIALVSDAGTPLISDPGFPLVRESTRQAIRVVPVPGPCASICALSAAGLPTDRFLFAGFPPRQSAQRLRWLKGLARVPATLVIYEASHRIVATLTDMLEAFGEAREAVIAREMTKIHETFLHDSISRLLQRVTEDPDQRRGEFVLLVRGFDRQAEEEITLDIETVLRALAAELPVKQAASLTARLTGHKKNELYQRILIFKSEKV